MSSARDTSRDIRRLAGLYNGVAFEQLRAMCWDVLLVDKLRDDNVHEIWSQECQEPVAKTPLFEMSVPEDVRRRFVSINRCVAVVVYNTAWLAYCIEGLDIEIKEITLTEPKRIHDVELRYVPGYQLSRTDYFHTILLLTPQSGEEPIVADASYAQYSFDNGINTFAEYLAEKVHKGSEFHYQNLGAEFEKNKVNNELNPWVSSKTAAIIRTTNNVVVRELAIVGGIAALLNLSQGNFEEARDKIFAAVKEEMDALRLQLEAIKYGRDATYLSSLDDLVESWDGAGHQLCMRSFERSK